MTRPPDLLETLRQGIANGTLPTSGQALPAVIVRRTFEAAQHPEGSSERAELNRPVVTSEYQPSKRWAVVGDRFSAAFGTRGEAEGFVRHGK